MDSLRSKALGAMHSAGAGSRLGGQVSSSSSSSRACQSYSLVALQGCRESTGVDRGLSATCLSSGQGVCGDWCLREWGVGIWPLGRGEKQGGHGVVKGGCRRASFTWIMQRLLKNRSIS